MTGLPHKAPRRAIIIAWRRQGIIRDEFNGAYLIAYEDEDGERRIGWFKESAVALLAPDAAACEDGGGSENMSEVEEAGTHGS